MNRLGRMREKPDMPLTPVELFRRGIEITQQIRGRIEETRAYYLGRSSREPAQPLSEVFNPETGPIIPYFVKVIRMLTHPQAYLTLRQSAAVEHEFFISQFERIERKIESEHERTRRQIIKSINTRNIDGLDITGPRTPECRDQVLAVVVWLANPRHPQSIYHACERTFHFAENGYVDEERLYLWCHRNESRIWAWVETYRLDHSIS